MIIDCFRQGANEGFHEGLGELMGLTMSTIPYLVKIGLLAPGHHNTGGFCSILNNNIYPHNLYASSPHNISL